MLVTVTMSKLRNPTKLVFVHELQLPKVGKVQKMAAARKSVCIYFALTIKITHLPNKFNLQKSAFEKCTFDKNHLFWLFNGKDEKTNSPFHAAIACNKWAYLHDTL